MPLPDSFVFAFNHFSASLQSADNKSPKSTPASAKQTTLTAKLDMPLRCAPNQGIYGIDLGSTCSCIATLDSRGSAVLVPNLVDASNTLDCAICFDSSDNVIIGHAARQMWECHNDRVILFDLNQLHNPHTPVYKVLDKTFTPVQVCSLILRRLKSIAAEQGEPLRKAVITCPPDFGPEQRAAIREAGRLAGIEVLDVLDTPTASVLSWCRNHPQRKGRIMLCDLGGSNFLVSLLQVQAAGQHGSHQLQLLSHRAAKLGSKDWTSILHKYLLNAVCDDAEVTSAELDEETREILFNKVEQTKIKLSFSERSMVRILCNGTMTITMVTRSEFERMTAHLVLRALCHVSSVLDSLGDTKPDLVLLTGGAANMPIIQRAMELCFPGQVQLLASEESAARGAAIWASIQAAKAAPRPQTSLLSNM